jgi:hypothetical protein
MRLAAWRQRLDDGGTMQPWLARIYVRVLSFMVARYAPESADDLSDDLLIAKSAALDDRPAAAETNMEFRVADSSASGKAPRSAADIRSVLQAVQQGQAPRRPDGPLAGGLSRDDAILVADFRSRADARHLQSQLEANGVTSKTVRTGSRFQVFVPFRDLEKAKPIVASHAEAVRKEGRYRPQADSVYWAGVGALLGFVAVFVMALLIQAIASSGPVNWGVAAALALSVGGPVGACLGITVGMFFES